jgi:hypothetical protein
MSSFGRPGIWIIKRANQKQARMQEKGEKLLHSSFYFLFLSEWLNIVWVAGGWNFRSNLLRSFWIEWRKTIKLEFCKSSSSLRSFIITE